MAGGRDLERDPPGKLQNVHALVVDDHDDARELLTLFLEKAGAKVTQADSVRAAVRAISTANVQVLVSDIGMPDEDGYDLIRRVRGDAALVCVRGIPAIAVTAFSAAADRRKAIAAGFQEHLPKPCDSRHLVEVVARLVHAAGEAAPGEGPVKSS